MIKLETWQKVAILILIMASIPFSALYDDGGGSMYFLFPLFMLIGMGALAIPCTTIVCFFIRGEKKHQIYWKVWFKVLLVLDVVLLTFCYYQLGDLIKVK